MRNQPARDHRGRTEEPGALSAARLMRDLSLAEVLDLHSRLLAMSGGALGVRDLGAAESAVSRPQGTFAGEDRHAALDGFSC